MHDAVRAALPRADWRGTHEQKQVGRGSPPHVDALAGSWWVAFEAAQAALHAAASSLEAGELHERLQRLADERSDMVALLRDVDRETHAHSPLVRWLGAPAAGSSLLGLPSGVVACVFDLDGVLTTSATAHTAAWAQTFDPFLATRAGTGARDFVPFDERHDYRDYLASQPRLVGTRAFLASRGISLPLGSRDDRPGADTLYGLANRKNSLLQQRLEHDGVTAFAGSRSYLEGARMLGIRRAVVSASASTERILREAGLASLIEAHIDADSFESEQLRPKPAPDSVVAALRRLQVDASQTAVFETTLVGIAAARAAGVRLVIAVDRGGPTHELRASDADLVVNDLAELFPSVK